MDNEDFAIPSDAVWITDTVAVCLHTKRLFCTSTFNFKNESEQQAWMATVYDAWKAKGLPMEDCPIEQTKVDSNA